MVDIIQFPQKVKGLEMNKAIRKIFDSDVEEREAEESARAYVGQYADSDIVHLKHSAWIIGILLRKIERLESHRMKAG